MCFYASLRPWKMDDLGEEQEMFCLGAKVNALLAMDMYYDNSAKISS